MIREASLKEEGMVIDYREDGWPYCPQCRKDELWTTANSPNLSDHLDKEFHCYVCGWNGRLEDRELVEYEEVDKSEQ